LLAIGGAALSAVLSVVLIAMQGTNWGNEFLGVVGLLIAFLLVISIQAFEISRMAEATPTNSTNRQRLNGLLAAGAVVAAGSICLSIAEGPHGLIAPLGIFLQLVLSSLGRYRFAT